MDLKTGLGLEPQNCADGAGDTHLLEYANSKLAACGCPVFGSAAPSVAAPDKAAGKLSPVDQAIQDFLAAYLEDEAEPDECFVPRSTLVLDRHGLARTYSLPPDRDIFESDIVRSYRVQQGVLHNPKSDRRTTEGIFHITEGGLPIPADKKAVPKTVFAELLRRALNPPASWLRLPFTASQQAQAETWVSLLLRPVVCPHVEGFIEEKSMEVRFFAPGNLVGNLDFVESIFGNAGDPSVLENDARLDFDHWSGHTGCVILAPHLITTTKKELGLPPAAEATPRQLRDAMCWTKPDERYNEGRAFKITARDSRGVIVTIIADNYFGYCKKEVKTQLSYAANLFGQVEEEHSGGAIAFPSYDLGDDFRLSTFEPVVDHAFAETISGFGDIMTLQPEGYGVDKRYPDILYVPENVFVSLPDQSVSWEADGKPHTLRLKPGFTYVLPSGYKVELQRPSGGFGWRLVGTTAEGTLCHKPCTVSGGGKSEISKSIADAILTGPVVTSDFDKDLDAVEAILNRDYHHRFRDPTRQKAHFRAILSTERSLGSVIMLFTPSPDFTEEHNAFIASVPRHIRDLVLIVKMLYKPSWGANWRERFSVDLINGQPGRLLKYRSRPLATNFLRLGFTETGSWRTFTLRKDFQPAFKIQSEDDITASVVVPAARLTGLNPKLNATASLKFVQNCEYRLFQRPDDAIHRGYDKTTERDFSRHGTFFSNYEPITRETAQAMLDDALGFDQFSAPLQKLITSFAAGEHPDYIVCSAHPRVIDGKPSKNPRYLQVRPDLEIPRAVYLAEIGRRFYRRVPIGSPLPAPVNAILPGKRHNPPDPEGGVRALAVYNPIHYQELPELFMDFIASLTGKSPSTTGAGSEGALTKGPFNALPPIIDLNNALVSCLATNAACFVTAAGCIGPKYRFDHDISLLVPEVWCRLTPRERDPSYLIANGYLERCEDFEHGGRTVEAGRLGWRITERFVTSFFGRVLSSPRTVFTDDMLRPELQDRDIFADGMDNIVGTQRKVAQNYFEDGSIKDACPPLRALLHIMAHGQFQGRGLMDPAVRSLFTREAMLASPWYAARLAAQQRNDRARAERQVAALAGFLKNPPVGQGPLVAEIRGRLARAQERLKLTGTSDYVESLKGTLGTDPSIFS